MYKMRKDLGDLMYRTSNQLYRDTYLAKRDRKRIAEMERT